MAGDIIATRVAGSAVATKTDLVRGLSKAWANLNGTGTIVLRDSLNIGSVVDNGVGDYKFNFTAAMANANYAYAGMSTSDGNSARGSSAPTIKSSAPPTTTDLTYLTLIGATASFDGSTNDFAYSSFGTKGDLA